MNDLSNTASMRAAVWHGGDGDGDVAVGDADLLLGA